MAKRIRKRKCVCCGTSSRPTIGTGIGKGSALNLNAERPLKRKARAAGSINRITATTSTDRSMSPAYRSGVKLILAIPGEKKKRYKITCPGKLWKIPILSRLLDTLSPLLPLRYKMSWPHNRLF